MSRSNPVPFSTCVKHDKVVIELSFKSLLAGVEAANRRAREINREDPREKWPLFAVTDVRAYAAFVLRCLKRGRPAEIEKLSDIFEYNITFNLDDAARRKAGLKAIPQPSKPGRRKK